MSGMADTMSWENTKAPTLMSIYSRISAETSQRKEKKGARERHHISRTWQAREDGYEHHVRAIRAQRGQTRGWLGLFEGSITIVAMVTRVAKQSGR